jgi:serine/threonine protein kinase
MGVEDQSSDTELPPGTMLGKYEVLRKLATGGMAQIYLARARGRAGFEKLFVIKRILPSVAEDGRLIQMFLDEAKLVATLQHPNIADVHEVGEDIDAPYFVMEHIHGEDVRTMRLAASERKQGVPLRVSLAIVHAVASALDYAHARKGPDGKNLNLVHRDVSSSNILVGYEGAIKLIDFGVARVSGGSQTTQVGTVKGKCPYMSPEQCQGHPLDRRSDLFSLGVVMYELTVGKRPFGGENEFEIMRQIVHTDARRPSQTNEQYPARLEKIVMKLLARNMSARYRSGEELLGDLEPFMDHHQLWIPPKKISRYLQSLFTERLAAWERAIRGDFVTFVDKVALAIEPERRPGETPPTPVPVLMRLSLEIEAVALDSELSLAHVLRPGEDPMNAILAPDDELGGESIALKGGDTITIRTGEKEAYGVPSSSPADASDVPEHAGGDTVTVPPGRAGTHLSTGDTPHDEEASLVPGGDTITQPPGAADVLSGDTVTVPPGQPADRTAAAIAATQPAPGGGYRIHSRAATATSPSNDAGKGTGTGGRAATSAETGSAAPASGRAATNIEAPPPAAPTRPSGVVNMWRPASVAAGASSEADDLGLAAPTPDPAAMASDADAIEEALGAPSILRALDALGPYDDAPKPDSMRPATESWEPPTAAQVRPRVPQGTPAAPPSVAPSRQTTKSSLSETAPHMVTPARGIPPLAETAPQRVATPARGITKSSLAETAPQGIITPARGIPPLAQTPLPHSATPPRGTPPLVQTPPPRSATPARGIPPPTVTSPVRASSPPLGVTAPVRASSPYLAPGTPGIGAPPRGRSWLLPLAVFVVLLIAVAAALLIGRS